MSIQSELVREVVGLYQTWWGICSPADWADFQGRIQEPINNCGACVVIPVMDLHESGPKLGKALRGNPLEMAPHYQPEKVPGPRVARFAGRAAQLLVEMGHPVFYLSTMTASTAILNGHDQLVKDITAFAPVVVWRDMKADTRLAGRMDDLLMARQWGFLIRVIEDKSGAGFSE